LREVRKIQIAFVKLASSHLKPQHQSLTYPQQQQQREQQQQQQQRQQQQLTY